MYVIRHRVDGSFWQQLPIDPIVRGEFGAWIADVRQARQFEHAEDAFQLALCEISSDLSDLEIVPA